MVVGGIYKQTKLAISFYIVPKDVNINMTDVSKPKRARKANWDPRDTEKLVDFVSEHNAVLNSSFNSTITNKQKLTLWSTITERLNSSGSVRRDVDDIKKKWSDLKSNSRKKAANVSMQASLTGGGPPPPSLTDLDLKILSTIPKCQIEGCAGGIESEVTVIPECDFSPRSESVSTGEILSNSEQAAIPSPDCQMNEAAASSEVLKIPSKDSKQPCASSSSASTSVAYSSSTSVISKRKTEKSSKIVNETQASRADSLLDIERQKLDIMKQMLAIMQRRLELEEERMRQSNTPVTFSLSPVIKF